MPKPTLLQQQAQQDGANVVVEPVPVEVRVIENPEGNGYDVAIFANEQLLALCESAEKLIINATDLEGGASHTMDLSSGDNEYNLFVG